MGSTHCQMFFYEKKQFFEKKLFAVNVLCSFFMNVRVFNVFNRVNYAECSPYKPNIRFLKKRDFFRLKNPDEKFLHYKDLKTLYEGAALQIDPRAWTPAAPFLPWAKNVDIAMLPRACTPPEALFSVNVCFFPGRLQRLRPEC